MIAMNPKLNRQALQLIIRLILNRKTAKLKSSHIVNFLFPHIGRIASHGNKRVKRYKSDLIKDRRKKKRAYKKRLLTNEKLLY